MRWCLTLLFFAVLAAPASAQERKYALLVGVKRYDGKTFVQIPSAEKDALALDQTLRSLGFDLVITMTNEAELPARRPSSARKILDQLDLMLNGKEPDDTVLVFLSGHGIQLRNDPVDSTGNKETYFCPEEANVRDKTSLVAIGEVMKRLSACPASRKLLLIDSCREEMLAEEAAEKSGGTIELKPVQVKRPPPPAGLAVLFSCSPGETSHAFKKLGDQGAFTHFTLKYLKGEADAGLYGKGELLTSELAAYVARETNDYVIDQLGKQQVPEFLTPGGLRPWPLGKLSTTDGIAEGTRAGDVRSFTDLGVKFCWCPAGSFRMGSPTTEVDRFDDESQVDVTLTRGFWLGQTEVTQGQWKSVMGTKPWVEHGDKRWYRAGADYPAVCMNWEDATAFCVRLTERERMGGRIPSGWSYRLPSEAEWEYACRAGTKSAYSFGERAGALTQYAWFDMNAGDIGGKYAHTVGQKKANPWGLHDMHGNAWECCGDWYGDKLTGGRDPQGPSEGSYRVDRGGSWGSTAGVCRSACRGRSDPSGRLSDLGFRLALSPSVVFAETSHDDVVKQIRSLRSRPYIPFNIVEKKQGDDTLRREGFPTPSAKTGCYLVYRDRGHQVHGDKNLDHIKFLQKVGDQKIETEEDGRKWVESLRIGDEPEVLMIEPEQDRVRGGVSTKWKSKTTKFTIRSIEDHVSRLGLLSDEEVDGKKCVTSWFRELTSSVGLYVREKDNQYSLMMRVIYHHKDWSNAEAVTVDLNGKAFTFKRAESIESDHRVIGRAIRETLLFDLNERPEFVLALLSDIDANAPGKYIIRSGEDIEVDVNSFGNQLPYLRAVAHYYYYRRFNIK